MNTERDEYTGVMLSANHRADRGVVLTAHISPGKSVSYNMSRDQALDLVMQLEHAIATQKRWNDN